VEDESTSTVTCRAPGFMGYGERISEQRVVLEELDAPSRLALVLTRLGGEPIEP